MRREAPVTNATPAPTYEGPAWEASWLMRAFYDRPAVRWGNPSGCPPRSVQTGGRAFADGCARSPPPT